MKTILQVTTSRTAFLYFRTNSSRTKYYQLRFSIQFGIRICFIVFRLFPLKFFVLRSIFNLFGNALQLSGLSNKSFFIKSVNKKVIFKPYLVFELPSSILSARGLAYLVGLNRLAMLSNLQRSH